MAGFGAKLQKIAGFDTMQSQQDVLSSWTRVTFPACGIVLKKTVKNEL